MHYYHLPSRTLHHPANPLMIAILTHRDFVHRDFVIAVINVNILYLSLPGCTLETKMSSLQKPLLRLIRSSILTHALNHTHLTATLSPLTLWKSDLSLPWTT